MKSIYQEALFILMENTMESYWSGFQKLISSRGWIIDPNGTDSFGNLVDRQTRVVVDKKTGDKKFLIRRLIKGPKFIMDQTIVRDDEGNIISGLGVLDLVYPYEKEFVNQSSKIKEIQVDPVNQIVLKKLKKYYGDYDWVKKNKNIIIKIK